jgi:hypothetical protein
LFKNPSNNLEFPITKYFRKAGKYVKERDIERKGEKGRERETKFVPRV